MNKKTLQILADCLAIPTSINCVKIHHNIGIVLLHVLNGRIAMHCAHIEREEHHVPILYFGSSLFGMKVTGQLWFHIHSLFYLKVSIFNYLRDVV
jgi:hypothetical protein